MFFLLFLPLRGFHANIVAEPAHSDQLATFLLDVVCLARRSERRHIPHNFCGTRLNEMSLNSMSNYEPLEIILFKTVLIFLRVGLLAVIRKNINLSEFLSKLGRFVDATFDLRLRNIDQDRL